MIEIIEITDEDLGIFTEQITGSTCNYSKEWNKRIIKHKRKYKLEKLNGSIS